MQLSNKGAIDLAETVIEQAQTNKARDTVLHLFWEKAIKVKDVVAGASTTIHAAQDIINVITKLGELLKRMAP